MGLILLVEDEKEVRALVIEILGADHIILEAPTGAKALEFTRKVRPNVILLDMYLNSEEKSGGLEFLTALRAAQGMAEVPVLVISGFAERSMISDAYVAGATGFLAKPYDVAILQKMVGDLIEEETKLPRRLAVRLTNASRFEILNAIRMVGSAINGPETIAALKAAITQFDTPAGRLEDAQNTGAK